MGSIERKDFIRTLNDSDYNENVINTYNQLKNLYPYGVTIFRLFEIISRLFNIKDWDLFDYNEIQNGNFESYLVDFTRSYLNGNPTNFTELKNSILKAGYFSEQEKRLFEENKLDEKLWAILMVVTNKRIN